MADEEVMIVGGVEGDRVGAEIGRVVFTQCSSWRGSVEGKASSLICGATAGAQWAWARYRAGGSHSSRSGSAGEERLEVLRQRAIAEQRYILLAVSLRLVAVLARSQAGLSWCTMTSAVSAVDEDW